MEITGGVRPDAPGTLNEIFFETIDRYDKPDALLYKEGGRYRPISHRTMESRARHIARGLAALGVARGERVGIASENRPEWALCDWGMLTGGFTSVPVYPTLPAGQAAFLLRDSGVVATFVSTAEQAAKVASVRSQLPVLRHVVGFERAPGVDLTLAELEERGAAGETPDDVAAFRRSALAVSPDAIATIIYTSGTTGDPKGVQLAHDNFASNVRAILAAILDLYQGTDVGLSFLPLSHSFERTSGHFAMFATGTTIAYSESLETIAADMLAVRPTVMIGVPRVYEKIYGRIFETARQGGKARAAVAAWAGDVGSRWADAKVAGRVPLRLAVQHAVADRLVYAKLRERTGGRLRFFVSGGAPLAPEICKFFFAAGLQILEGYGLTETSPVVTCSRPNDFRPGSVGKPLPGVEVRIAEDGEILTRGPHVMRGYFNRPEATRESIDDEGWLHTGDIGNVRDGFLFVTDRKKDLIITAGGKNIAPQPIENMVKTNRFVSEVVMLGDRRKYPVLLVVPSFDVLGAWAREQGIATTEPAALVELPQVRAKVAEEVTSCLGGLARYESPKKIGLLAHELTIENGELTPSLKVKRRVVEQRYAAILERLYAEDDDEPSRRARSG